jgi:hypothetical protein
MTQERARVPARVQVPVLDRLSLSASRPVESEPATFLPNSRLTKATPRKFPQKSMNDA